MNANVAYLQSARNRREERKTADQVAELVAANKHLVTEGDSLVRGAKNIRIELKLRRRSDLRLEFHQADCPLVARNGGDTTQSFRGKRLWKRKQN
jgi:hypothetical protein